MLKARANVNAADDAGSTALIKAAENGKMEVTQVLLDAGADIDARNNIGDKAFIQTVHFGKENHIKQTFALMMLMLKRSPASILCFQHCLEP